MAAQTVSDLEWFLLSRHRYCARWNATICPIISICVDFFARRGEDFVGLLRVCASVLAHQNLADCFLKLQELISRLESNVVHFQARNIFCGKEAVLYFLKVTLAKQCRMADKDGQYTRLRTEFEIWGSQKCGFHMEKNVSEWTLRRLRQEMGWPSREQELSQISDDTFDIVVRNLITLSVTQFWGANGVRALRGRGLLVQRNRVRQFNFQSRSRQQCSASF